MPNRVNTGITMSDTTNLPKGQKLMVKEAMMAMVPSSPDPDLISSDNLEPGNSEYRLLTYARLADAEALVEGADLTTIQQLYPNYMIANPSEHGVLVGISTRAERRQPESLMSMGGELMGVSMRARQTKDVFPLYDGFSKEVGGAGDNLDITFFNGICTYLNTDHDSEFGPAPMPYMASLHPEHISRIIGDLTMGTGIPIGDQTGSGVTTDGIRPGLATELMQNWYRGSYQIYSAQVYSSGYMRADSAGDAKGGIFAPAALWMIMEASDEFEHDKDNSRRLTEYSLFKSWDEVERADPHGAEMYFAADPTV